MARIIVVIVVALVVLVAALLALASTRPDSFSVQRTTSIAAPPQEIYALIEDFRKWRGWSPYETLDPDLQRAYSGARRGVGAAYGWSGKKAGSGKMTIIDTAAPRQVDIRLEFTAPMKSVNLARFTLKPVGDATEVTWEMHGPSPLVTKVMGLVFNLDVMIGKDFETGLAQLKALAEKT